MRLWWLVALLLAIAGTIYMYTMREAFAAFEYVEEQRGVVYVPLHVYDDTILNNPRNFDVRREDTTAFFAPCDVTCGNSAHYKARGNFVVACTDDEYVALFISKPSGIYGTKIAALASEPIGYLWDEDLDVMSRLFKAFEINYVGELVKLASVEFSRVHYVFVLANTKAIPVPQWEMASVVAYNEITPAMVAEHFPFANIKQVQTSFYMPGYVGPEQVMTVLLFPNLLHTAKKETSVNIDYCAKAFVDTFGTLEILSTHFRLHPATMRYLKMWRIDLSNERHDYFGVIETFGEAIVVDARERVDGFLRGKTRVFEMREDHVEGAPLIIGDVVNLQGQQEPEENGAYVVVDFREDGGATLERRRFEEKPLTEEDDTFYCVTSPDLVYKHECLSPVDPLTGNLKHHVDVWDGPCVFSSQCPFYRYDEDEGAYVGRCVDGACEMPPGHTRVGFRKYINQ